MMRCQRNSRGGQSEKLLLFGYGLTDLVKFVLTRQMSGALAPSRSRRGGAVIALYSLIAS